MNNSKISFEQLIYIFENNPNYDFRTEEEGATCWVRRIIYDTTSQESPLIVWRFYIMTGPYETPIEIELNDETEIYIKDGAIIITPERRASITVRAYKWVREFEIPSIDFAKKMFFT